MVSWEGCVGKRSIACRGKERFLGRSYCWRLYLFLFSFLIYVYLVLYYKGRVVPWHSTNSYWCLGTQLHSFLNSTLDGVSGQLHSLATLIPGKEPAWVGPRAGLGDFLFNYIISFFLVKGPAADATDAPQP